METIYFMETVEASNFLAKKIRELWNKYEGKAPAPGAPVDDYMIIIGDEFYKASADVVSRACIADAGRAKDAINDGVCCVCLAVGGKGNKAADAGKNVDLTSLLIDSKFVDGLKKQAKTPFMLRLAMSIQERASWLGEEACSNALMAVAKGREIKAPESTTTWSLLAATIRAFNALAQGRPVNIPDIAYGLAEYDPLLEIACATLVENVYAAIVKQGDFDYDSKIHSCADVVDFAIRQITESLACCNTPGVTVDDTTFKVDYPASWTIADFSIDETTYLLRKAQDMAPTPEMTKLKGKCIKAHNDIFDQYALAEAAAEYLDAVRNSL